MDLRPTTRAKAFALATGSAVALRSKDGTIPCQSCGQPKKLNRNYLCKPCKAELHATLDALDREDAWEPEDAEPLTLAEERYLQIAAEGQALLEEMDRTKAKSAWMGCAYFDRPVIERIVRGALLDLHNLRTLTEAQRAKRRAA